MPDQSSPNLLYLWPRRTLHIGQLLEPVQFSQAAASLTVTLEGEFSFRTSGMATPRWCRSLLLPPGDSVTVDTGEAMIGICYLDALGQDYAWLHGQMTDVGEGAAIDVPRETEFRSLFRALHQAPQPSDAAYAALERIINPRQSPYPEVDTRVAKVVALIRESVEVNRSVEELAQAVNLSVPRLIQLFRHQVGVPIRRYRQWHRLFITTLGVAQGKSLTQAAVDAGFTDSAHFSHTFRSTLGLKPSDVLTVLGRTQLIAPTQAVSGSEQSVSFRREP
ncbi:MAG: helix-turn-helix domain-containing protein [Marinobacter sp.]|uniref:helix-turn-helix domain-containing protein n=1 Tax=Marinobacter sp. TaxID=50741 RepID=UPI00299D5C7E|nr:helix-turn-helix domain-containing protein [Marinobacter sp.]MDX1756082.1 helix-turn-helix domain-containing protein [Marinobacter sp.]